MAAYCARIGLLLSCACFVGGANADAQPRLVSGKTAAASLNLPCLPDADIEKLAEGPDYSVRSNVKERARGGDFETARCLVLAHLRLKKNGEDGAEALRSMAHGLNEGGAVSLADQLYTSYRAPDSDAGRRVALWIYADHAALLLAIGQNGRAASILHSIMQAPAFTDLSTGKSSMLSGDVGKTLIYELAARAAEAGKDYVRARDLYGMAVASSPTDLSSTGKPGDPLERQEVGELVLNYAEVLAKTKQVEAADPQFRRGIGLIAGNAPTRPDDATRASMMRYAVFLAEQGRTRESIFMRSPSDIATALENDDFAGAAALANRMFGIATSNKPSNPQEIQMALELSAEVKNRARGNREPDYSLPTALLKCGPWTSSSIATSPVLVATLQSARVISPKVSPREGAHLDYIWPALPGDPEAALFRNMDRFIEYAGRCRESRRPIDALAVLTGVQSLFEKAGHNPTAYRKLTLALAAAHGQTGDFDTADRIYNNLLAKSDQQIDGEFDEILNFYINNGRYDRAELYYREAALEDVGGNIVNPFDDYRLIDLLLLQGKNRQAHELIEANVAAEPSTDFSDKQADEAALAEITDPTVQSDLASETLGQWNNYQARLARIALIEGDAAKAASGLSKAVALNATYFANLKQAGGEVWPFLPYRLTAPLYSPMGSAYYSLGDFVKARDAYKMAVASKANDVSLLNTRESLVLAEELTSDLGRYAETIARTRGSRAEIDKMLGFGDGLIPLLPNAGDEMRASFWASQVAIGLIRPDYLPRALSVGAKLYALLEKQWAIGSESALDVEWQKRQLRAATGRYVNYASLLWTASNGGSARTYRDLAFRALQRGMQDTTDLSIANAAARAQLSNLHPELLSVLDRRDALVANYLAGSSNRLATGMPPKTATKALDEFAAIDSRLRAEAPDYLKMVRSDPLSPVDASALLRPSEAMLLLIPGEFGTHIVTITREGVHWHKSDMRQDDIALAVKRLLWFAGGNVTVNAEEEKTWTQAVSGGRNGFDRQTAFALYRQLIAPALPDILGKEQLFIAAGGALSSLPFAVLVSHEPSGRDDDPTALRSTRWFGDDFALVKAPSLQALALLRGRQLQVSEGTASTFAGFGDPTLGGRNLNRGARSGGRSSAIEVDTVYGANTDDDASINPKSLAALAQLPGTSVEITSMARAFSAPDTAIHLANNDTETALKAADLSATRVIAFATHGLTAGELHGIRLPGLVFTPPATATPTDDGYLSSSEIAVLKLNADWVILSACNTASGDGSRGAPGMSGLARAFFYAGARNLLASHWPVRDDVASLLTVRAVELSLRKPALTRAKALQRAMSEIRNDTSQDGVRQDGVDGTWAHPNAWAPFSLIGGGD